MMPAHPGRLLTKAFWAVMDQGLFAVSNFLLNVMLARWLSPQEYGAFAVSLTVFLLLGTVHTALLTDPMLVFGPGRYSGRHREYLRVLLSGHWGLVAAAGLLLGLSSVVAAKVGSTALASTLLGLAFAGPCILLLWFMRRVCYVSLEPRLAASAGFMYLVLMATGLGVLYQRAWLSTFAALCVMGMASVAASLWLGARLRLSVSPSPANSLTGETLRAHWEYGRWSVATEALMWVPGNIYYLVMPVWQGLEASAALKALTNLILPVQHLSSALGVLLVPALVRARGSMEFGRLTQVGVAVLSAGALVYWGLLILFHRPIIAWLYGGQYQGYVQVLWMLGFVVVASSVVNVLGAALRALERPDQVFRAYGLSTVAVVAFGLWFTAAWGVVGAGIGLALSSATKAAAMWAYYRRLGGSHVPQGAPQVVGATHAV